MDMDKCTTVFNRSNYCSILKKRKSLGKENTITVKLKKHFTKAQDKTTNKNNSVHKNSLGMCLICRSENDENMMCNSLASPNREDNQKRQWKHDNDSTIPKNNPSSRKSQHILNNNNCMVMDTRLSSIKTSSSSSLLESTSMSTSALPSLSSSSSSPLPANIEWKALEEVNNNQTSWRRQSQRNAASVSSRIGHSVNDSCSLLDVVCRKRRSMPSCQLQFTSSCSSSSSSSSLSPDSSILNNTTHSSTELPSPKQKQPKSKLENEQLELSSHLGSEAAVAAAATSSSSSSSSLEISTLTTSSTELSKTTRTNNTSTKALMLPSPFSSYINNNSTSLISKSKTYAGLLRTFALVAVILEKCCYGMLFGMKTTSSSSSRSRSLMTITSKGRQSVISLHEHNKVKSNNNNQITTNFEKTNENNKKRNSRTKNYSGMPNYSIMLMILSVSFMTLMMLPTTTNATSTEVRLQRNETVCKSRDIRNSVSEFHLLTNCTVIEGFLLISLIEKTNYSAYEKYSFPMLTEVTEFVMIYRVSYLRTLSTLFPNLSIIRGKELFEGFALILYENPHMEELGLVSLTTIARGAVRFEKNPALCFVETIDWTRIRTNIVGLPMILREIHNTSLQVLSHIRSTHFMLKRKPSLPNHEMDKAPLFISERNPLHRELLQAYRQWQIPAHL